VPGLQEVLPEFVYSAQDFNYDVSWQRFNRQPRLSRVSVLLARVQVEQSTKSRTHAALLVSTCQFCANLRLPRLLHISAKSAYRILFSHKLAFSTAILIIICVYFTHFYHVLLPRRSGCQQNGTFHSVWTPVDCGTRCQDGVVGFNQFCTIFPHLQHGLLLVWSARVCIRLPCAACDDCVSWHISVTYDMIRYQLCAGEDAVS